MIINDDIQIINEGLAWLKEYKPEQYELSFFQMIDGRRRLLRQLSVQSDTSEREVDVDGTIHDTCDHAGTLHIRWKKPRKNAVKVLLLMDSGGSMEYYSKLCSMLFQAATKSNHFKELHTYYFHNTIKQSSCDSVRESNI